ncbi:MAG: membrane protein insertase YidC [Clostridia bacterium]|nr:membrane protein insertase YidC [Clostridia bacterium]
MFEYIITRPMGYIIEFIYNLVQNYGIAIILFTVVIKLILTPLNVKSQKSMRKQQKIQPYLAELQKKYANDQEKLNRETMKLYKENNISMAGGCLPMLIQMPILIGLYQVIQKPLSYLLHVNFNDPDVIRRVYALRDAYADSKLITRTEEQLANMNQINISQWAQLNGDKDWIINFKMFFLDLANIPSKAFSYIGEVFTGNMEHLSIVLLLIIPILAVLASVGSMKISQSLSGQNNKSDDAAAQTANQMSKSMTMMMPVMTGFFTLTLPAGIGLYWIVSSVTQIIQQLALNLYFDKKKEDEIVVNIPEQKQLHSKKRKKHR